MEEKRILIFEDEWSSIKGSFELANLISFEGKLNFIIKSRSQDIDFSSMREQYDMVFVDITLAKNTILDGFSIIKEIKNNNLIELEKVIVLTGNSKVEEKLAEMDIDTSIVNVLYKPIAFNVLAEQLKTKFKLK